MAKLMLDPGQMTARLVLFAPNDVSDGQGGVTRSWDEKAQFWGALRPLSQASDEVAGGETVRALFDIWLLMRRDIEAGMRLCLKARTFTVISTRDGDESNRFLICRCREEI
jgi:SPP1 family predicted phage head-tail adaptor